MAKILFTWELGAYFGHLRRDAPIAQKLQDADHQILFAVRDTKIAAAVLLPLALDFVQAPVLMGKARLQRRPASYSELLLAEGYGQKEVLSGGVKSWLKLFDLYHPDVVVADHSPTALIAARVCKLPVVQIGCSFSIPPRNVPMPAFSVPSKLRSEVLLKSEALLVNRINSEIVSCGSSAKLLNMADLFDTDDALLMCFEALDHYGKRLETRYLGPVFTSGETIDCRWESEKRVRIFAYLHAGVAGTDELLEALKETDAEVICVLTGIQGSYKTISSHMRLFGSPVSLQFLLPQADLVVSNGGGSLCSQALLAGVPMLLMPGHMEQLLQSKCLEKIGAGRVIGFDRKISVVREEVRAISSNDECRFGAQKFSASHASFDPKAPIITAAKMIENVVSRSAIAA